MVRRIAEINQQVDLILEFAVAAGANRDVRDWDMSPILFV
jgi:hypothetical protein